MNGKFSTLMAGLLLASAFTANAGIVKVATPVPGKAYAISASATITEGKTTGYYLNVNSDGVAVSTHLTAVASVEGLTKWTYALHNTEHADYGFTLKTSGKALTLSTDKWSLSETASNPKGLQLFKVNTDKFGVDADGTGEVAPIVNKWIALPNTGDNGAVTVSATQDNGTALYYLTDAYNAGDIKGLYLNATTANGNSVFIKLGDKYLAPKDLTAAGTEVELVEIDFDNPDYELIKRATWKFASATNSFEATNKAGNKKLNVSGDGKTLVMGDTNTEFKFDLNDYAAVKGAALTNAVSKVFNGEEFVTYDPSKSNPEALLIAATPVVTADVAGAITSSQFVSGNWYNVSLGINTTPDPDVDNYLKQDKTSKEFSAAVLGNSDEYLWQVSVSTVGDEQVVTLKNKATGEFFKLGGVTAFKATTNPAYTLGMNLMITTDKYVDKTLTADGGATAANIGLHTPQPINYTADELNAMEDKGFTMSIATAKKDGTTDIEGASVFSGKVTAVKVEGKTTVQLTDADGKYIVLDTKSAWGSSNELSGNNNNNRGYKFAAVAEKDLKDTHYSYYTVQYPGENEKSTNNELIITVYKDKTANAANLIGQLYVTKVADKYYLTVSKEIDAQKEVRPYVTLGGASLVDLTETFVAAPTYYSIVKVNEDGKALKALGVAFADAEGQWLDLDAVQLDQPEGQWYATSTTDKTKLVLANRENPSVTKTFTSLYKTDKTTDLRAASTIYKSGTEYLVLTPTALSDTKTSDGYEIWDQNDLRDEAFTLGLSTLFGRNAYLAENHEGKHQLGLVENVKEAATWKFTALTGKGKADGSVITDSVYVKNEITYWNANKKGGADWDTKVDYLKIVPYTIANAENGEPLWYSAVKDTASYICNPSGEADRFVVKKSADGKYNFIRVVKSADGKSWVLNQKMYAGFSAQYGNVQLTDIYQKRENDAFVIEKAAAPEYLKLNLGDTIRIFREGAESSLLFEKGEFLGLENIYEYTKMAPAMYVDTAFVNRTGKDNYINNCYQYLLAVEPDRHLTSEECTIPGHPSHSTDITYGRYLVSLKDSADVEAKRNLHTNKYLNSEKKAKFGFVKASHANDTLVIANSVYTGTLKQNNDSIYMGTKEFNWAKFAFKVADQDTKAFRIQTKEGFLKWMNGFIIATADEKDGDIFNLKATDENPTANEAIEAAGVQVIAGKGTVTVQGAAGKVVTVANILGQTIANQVAASDNVTIAAPAGVVVVAVEGEATKVVVK